MNEIFQIDPWSVAYAKKNVKYRELFLVAYLLLLS